MDVIEEKIRDLLNKAKSHLSNNNVNKTIEILDNVLSLDPFNDEAKYVKNRLSELGFSSTHENSKVIFYLNDNASPVTSIEIFVNELFITTIDDKTKTYVDFTIKNEMDVKFLYSDLCAKCHLEKGESSLIEIDIDKMNNILLIQHHKLMMNDEIMDIVEKLIYNHKFELASSILKQLIIYGIKLSLIYFQLLLIDCNVISKRGLYSYNKKIDSNKNFIKCMEHSNQSFKDELIKISDHIKENIYTEAVIAYIEENYDKSIQLFESIIEYKDSRDRILKMYNK